MKLIILEGGDRLGKSTLIEGLCKHFNYDNVSIRHFGKPPKNLNAKEVLDFQFEAFRNEMGLFKHMYVHSLFDKYNYYPETMIWNRSHLGEYVYSQMFRGGDPKVLKEKLIKYEEGFISHEVYLITLTADPYFFLLKEDGNSFSKNLEDKSRELELFKEAHDFSIIANKKIIKVDQEFNDGEIKGIKLFRPKQEILNEVINFIQCENLT